MHLKVPPLIPSLQSPEGDLLLVNLALKIGLWWSPLQLPNDLLPGQLDYHYLILPLVDSSLYH